MVWTQRLAIHIQNLIFCRLAWLNLLLPTLILNGVSAVDYSTLGVSDGWLMDMGLTEVPTNIPCTLNGNLDLRDNSITRIEADSFACLDKIYTLDLGYNELTYIAPGAFDPMLILTTVRLRRNRDLPELPPHYGPNTADMEYLFIQFINLQVIPPDSYFHQMPKLETLAIGIDLNNDFFDGWTALWQLSSKPHWPDSWYRKNIHKRTITHQEHAQWKCCRPHAVDDF